MQTNPCTFLSTPPSRVATGKPVFVRPRTHRFYPRHPRGWRPWLDDLAKPRLFVSIHATLAGGDGGRRYEAGPAGVSIHATLAGGDLRPLTYSYHRAMFLSTPPSRVATQGAPPSAGRYQFLSTPPSRVATMEILLMAKQTIRSFYPRHPRGWRPTLSNVVSVYLICFYPRHPRGWRLTENGGSFSTAMFLSTPPSRVATAILLSPCLMALCFYPRHPRGWRPVARFGVPSKHQSFLSTPPSRVATNCSQTMLLIDQSFYPRHPRGWRRQIERIER